MSSKKALVTLAGDASIDDILECLERDGGCIVKNMLPQVTIDGLWSDLADVLDVAPNGDGSFVGRKTKRISGLFSRSRHMQNLITQPQFFGAAEKHLCTPFKYWLDGVQHVSTPALQMS
ncbi:hypothetical protein [Pseudomonas sp. AMR01]|uniref:hypothetical protein n=1 Tax=Pseudomonas sp. AMR01 TaxID=3064904 RepID=UPI0035BF56EF